MVVVEALGRWTIGFQGKVLFRGRIVLSELTLRPSDNDIVGLPSELLNIRTIVCQVD